MARICDTTNTATKPCLCYSFASAMTYHQVLVISQRHQMRVLREFRALREPVGLKRRHLQVFGNPDEMV